MMTRDDHVIKKIMQVCDSWMHAGDAKMTALHDAAVKQGAMQQLLVWIGFFELFGFVAIVQMLQGGDRQPGDFGFDPLNCAKDPNVSFPSFNQKSARMGFVNDMSGEHLQLVQCRIRICTLQTLFSTSKVERNMNGQVKHLHVGSSGDSQITQNSET